MGKKEEVGQRDRQGERDQEGEKEMVTKAEGERALLILWPVCVTSTLLGRQMCR